MKSWKAIQKWTAWKLSMAQLSFPSNHLTCHSFAKHYTCATTKETHVSLTWLLTRWDRERDFSAPSHLSMRLNFLSNMLPPIEWCSLLSVCFPLTSWLSVFLPWPTCYIKLLFFLLLYLCFSVSYLLALCPPTSTCSFLFAPLSHNHTCTCTYIHLLSIYILPCM